ncbi:MAG: hypothetical protein AB1424_15040 [Thermodesulfobacteriota bacterium]
MSTQTVPKRVVVRPKGKTMANIGTLANLNDAVEQFNREAERVEKAKLNIFKVYWIVFRIYRNGRKLLRNFRILMSLCDHLCPEAGCMQKFYPKIKKLRDQYSTIYQLSLKSSRLVPFRHLLDKTLDDWDDLVEDSAIAADPEVRGLITQIADVL